jgi:hypothetical protein
MSFADKIAAMLEGLTRDQVGDMRPTARQRLADQCERVMRLARVETIVGDARSATTPKSGILHDLKRGHRAE